jgi:Fe-S-cluster-containing hydrogenase component 2
MTCLHVCPYVAPRIGFDSKAEVQGAVCMGCGSCTAECPAKAITLRHYVDAQIFGAMDSLLGVGLGHREIPLGYPQGVGVAPPRWRKAEKV